jgi:DNA modification methylase
MLINADARKIPLADKVVQCCVTSPPYYGLRDYGVDNQIGLEETPEQYIAKLVAVFREVKRVLRNDGVVFLNLGDTYINKQLLGIPWRVALALQADGWWLRNDIIWHKPNPMPESVTDRCTKAHEYIFLLSKSARYYYDNEAVFDTIDDTPSGRNRRTIWTITTKPYPGAHYAVFPPELPEICIKAGSAEGDVVLDTFVGSGTTCMVARELGRQGVGIDLSLDYLRNNARKRLELDKMKAWQNGGGRGGDGDLSELPMFGGNGPKKHHKNMDRENPHTMHKNRLD